VKLNKQPRIDRRGDVGCLGPAYRQNTYNDDDDLLNNVFLTKCFPNFQNFKQLSYPYDLITPYNPTRPFRSPHQHLLHESSRSTILLLGYFYHQEFFNNCSPVYYFLCCVHSGLKTHLFRYSSLSLLGRIYRIFAPAQFLTPL
jgi:hypothetical protein